jgi:S-adenosylmethionine uptake transporter
MTDTNTAAAPDAVGGGANGALLPAKLVSPLTGIALASGAYACFAAQDAATKWLVTDYAVAEILFIRSIVIAIISGLLARHYRHPSALRGSQRGKVLLRAALMLAGWLLYFNASRALGLAELTTLYFSAPIIVVFLSIVILKEKVGVGRWTACIGGFVGVAIAAYPTHAPSLVPAAMCLIAGGLWAWSTVLIRLVSRTQSSLSQMFATSLLFALACGLSMPFLWKTPDLTALGLMIGLGLISAVGQYLLYEGFRHASASTLAPVEYTGLIWAFVYGYAVFAEIPAMNVFAGALLIIGFGAFLVLWERRQAAAEKVPATA